MENFLKSVPVVLSSFEQEGQFTRAKLNIFYKGKTDDKRLFTEDFSNKILKTLPNTPVVAFYCEEKEDFIGHNSQQNAYGVVPADSKIEFVTDENGKEWAVTDVVLWTERKDIGDIAKKIVGKQQSLEIDPSTFKFKINKNLDGTIKEFEFIDGSFIGLSVLGDKQNPAFSGSCFFQENLEELKEKIIKFTELLSAKNNNNGGEKMLEKYLQELREFIKLSFDEKQEKIYQHLQNSGIYGIIKQQWDDNVIIDQYSENKGWEYVKYSIKTNEDGSYELENPQQVLARYYTTEEIEQIEKINFSKVDFSKIVEAIDIFELISENKELKQFKLEQEEKQNSVGNKGINNEENAKQADLTDCEEKNKEEEEQMRNAKAISSAAALSESEREELSNYRRVEKQELINNFKEYLTAEELNSFTEKIDEYDKIQLNEKLSLAFAKFAWGKMKEEKSEQEKTPSPVFSREDNEDVNYDPTNINSVMKKYKTKK